MSFRNRAEAAELLADALADRVGPQPLILAIPRGAVPMGRILADRLGGDLDVVLVKKLGAPNNPEFAVGTVAENGTIARNPGVPPGTVDDRYLEAEAERQLATLRERRRRYSNVHPPLDPAGREVVVVDDGIATGSTLSAAVHALRRQRPARIVAAVAVAPPATATRLRGEVDELVVLDTPAEFYAVGQFFDEFPQVGDDEVVRLLARA